MRLVFLAGSRYCVPPLLPIPIRNLRFDGETDVQFQHRAERAAVIARILIEACLANHEVQELIADPSDPHSLESLRRNPIVRVDYDQAYAVSTIGEGLYATRNKHWGAGPNILPLEADDPCHGQRIIYVFKEHSVYNRRFLQRQRLKEILGRTYRPLVEWAKYKRCTKRQFLEDLNEEQAQVIRMRLGIEPGDFWRACKGKLFLDLPPRDEQLYLDFMADDREPQKRL